MTASKSSTIAVIGAWHQASVVSACFADMGHRVRGIGDDAAAVAGLGAGRAPVYEPGLDAMLERNLKAGRLRYTTSYAEGLKDADFAFVCIDTPVGPDDESDLTSIYRAVDSIAAYASNSFILCVSAQVPVGTCAQLVQTLAERQPDYSIPVVYVPEFLRLGSAIQTFREADRFVIGADDPEHAARVASLYEPLGRPIRITDVRSAEMAKHAANAFLAMSISFINQIADLCEHTGADVTEVAEILKLDRRIGPYAYLSAGMGYAGGTLGREIRALRQLGKQHTVDTGLLDAVEQINSRRVLTLLRRLKQVYPVLGGVRVGVLGLTYKPGTSTLRRSAALELIDLLLAEHATVAAFDPLARLSELPEPPPFQIYDDPMEVAQDASVLVLVAPWADIDQFDFSACAKAMKQPVLLDTGNFLSPANITGAGFTYMGVGRGTMQESS